VDHYVSDDFEGLRVNGENVAAGFAGDVENFPIGTHARAFRFAGDGDERQIFSRVGIKNGRRADIMALGPRGQIAIAEVKSSLEDFRTDRKWGEYLPYCDAFYFAVAPEFPRGILPETPGLIVADGFGGAGLSCSFAHWKILPPEMAPKKSRVLS